MLDAKVIQSFLSILRWIKLIFMSLFICYDYENHLINNFDIRIKSVTLVGNRGDEFGVSCKIKKEYQQ